MINFRVVTFGAIAALLMGCGAGDQNSDTGEKPRVYHGTPVDRNISLADIAGEWYATFEIPGPNGDVWAVDEFYLRITEDGKQVEYDYQGDSRADKDGSYANCYIKRPEFSIEEVPEGGFYLRSDPVSFSGGNDTVVTVAEYYYAYYDLQDGNLLAPVRSTKDNPISVLAYPSPISQAELDSMLCEE